MICRHCGATLDDMDGVLVDATSGDAGGTYDYCPDNPVGTEDERLHEVRCEPDPTIAGRRLKQARMSCPEYHE